MAEFGWTMKSSCIPDSLVRLFSHQQSVLVYLVTSIESSTRDYPSLDDGALVPTEAGGKRCWAYHNASEV